MRVALTVVSETSAFKREWSTSIELNAWANAMGFQLLRHEAVTPKIVLCSLPHATTTQDIRTSDPSRDTSRKALRSTLLRPSAPPAGD